MKATVQQEDYLVGFTLLDDIIKAVCKGASQRIDAPVLVDGQRYRATVYRIDAQELVRCDLRPRKE